MRNFSVSQILSKLFFFGGIYLWCLVQRTLECLSEAKRSKFNVDDLSIGDGLINFNIYHCHFLVGFCKNFQVFFAFRLFQI